MPETFIDDPRAVKTSGELTSRRAILTYNKEITLSNMPVTMLRYDVKGRTSAKKRDREDHVDEIDV